MIDIWHSLNISNSDSEVSDRKQHFHTLTLSFNSCYWHMKQVSHLQHYAKLAVNCLWDNVPFMLPSITISSGNCYAQVRRWLDIFFDLYCTQITTGVFSLVLYCKTLSYDRNYIYGCCPVFFCERELNPDNDSIVKQEI